MKQHRIERILAEGVANQGSISVEHVVEALVEEIREDEEYWVPVKYDDDRSGFQILLVEDENGSTYLPAYTSQEEFEKSGEPEPCTLSLDMLVKRTAEEADLDGMVINPYGYAGKLNKGVLWYVIERKEPKNNDYIFYNRMINKALRFAIDWHSGQVRKGTTEGFITHPVEVMSIMNQMGMASIDPNLMIAGILHDTVEDTCATRDMIRWQFGRDVADLVDAHTEDKALSWEERKQLLMTELKTADIRIKILVMADVLANLRSLLRDCRRVGDQVWERFNARRKSRRGIIVRFRTHYTTCSSMIIPHRFIGRWFEAIKIFLLNIAMTEKIFGSFRSATTERLMS